MEGSMSDSADFDSAVESLLEDDAWIRRCDRALAIARRRNLARTLGSYLIKGLAGLGPRSSVVLMRTQDD